jgi:hypothetical protein
MTGELAPSGRQNARRFGSLMSFVELSARSGSRWCRWLKVAAGGGRRPLLGLVLATSGVVARTAGACCHRLLHDF